MGDKREHRHCAREEGARSGRGEQETARWADPALGPGKSVCELRIQESAMEERNHLFDEPEGELLGQCADGKLLRDIEDGMRSQEKLPDA